MRKGIFLERPITKAEFIPCVSHSCVSSQSGRIERFSSREITRVSCLIDVAVTLESELIVCLLNRTKNTTTTFTTKNDKLTRSKNIIKKESQMSFSFSRTNNHTRGGNRYVSALITARIRFVRACMEISQGTLVDCLVSNQMALNLSRLSPFIGCLGSVPASMGIDKM